MFMASIGSTDKANETEWNDDDEEEAQRKPEEAKHTETVPQTSQDIAQNSEGENESDSEVPVNGTQMLSRGSQETEINPLDSAILDIGVMDIVDLINTPIKKKKNEWTGILSSQSSDEEDQHDEIAIFIKSVPFEEILDNRHAWDKLPSEFEKKENIRLNYHYYNEIKKVMVGYYNHPLNNNQPDIGGSDLSERVEQIEQSEDGAMAQSSMVTDVNVEDLMQSMSPEAAGEKQSDDTTYPLRSNLHGTICGCVMS